jgi:hypothetical protein
LCSTLHYPRELRAIGCDNTHLFNAVFPEAVCNTPELGTIIEMYNNTSTNNIPDIPDKAKTQPQNVSRARGNHL